LESANYTQLLYGYTPFFPLFSAEAVLPTYVRYCAPRVVAYVEEDAQTALEDALDLLDEARDVTLARSTVYQQSLCNYHNRRVRGRSFEPVKFVLCLKQRSTSKLESPWEGPYLVHEAIPGRAYRLHNPKTRVDKKNLWNTTQLGPIGHPVLSMSGYPYGGRRDNSKK
jgi:hypothetical protein